MAESIVIRGMEKIPQRIFSDREKPLNTSVSPRFTGWRWGVVKGIMLYRWSHII